MTSLLAFGGPTSGFKALETLVHLSRAQFLCRAAESEARRGHVNLRTGFSGHPQPPPLLPSHTCQGGCPQWSWGSDPGVGLHSFASSPCLLASTSQRGRRRAHLARGPFLSTVHFLSQLWETMHVSTELPTRERRPRIWDNANPCFLSGTSVPRPITPLGRTSQPS